MHDVAPTLVEYFPTGQYLHDEFDEDPDEVE